MTSLSSFWEVVFDISWLERLFGVKATSAAVYNTICDGLTMHMVFSECGLEDILPLVRKWHLAPFLFHFNIIATARSLVIYYHFLEKLLLLSPTFSVETRQEILLRLGTTFRALEIVLTHKELQEDMPS